ncbi:MAG: hypothetical protein QM742_09990 [Aquabacterium sp.]
MRTVTTGINGGIGLNRKIKGYVSSSQVTRVAEDGLEQVYKWSSTLGLFVYQGGSGSFDTLQLTGSPEVWTWTDGDTGLTETYELTNAGKDARLVKITDKNNKAVTLSYEAGMVKTATTAGNEKVEFTYETVPSSTSIRIKSILVKNAAGTVLLKRVTYEYDDSNRLQKVNVDLTPDKLDDAADVSYWTEYVYYAGTKQLQFLRQKDGSELEFQYGVDGKLEFLKETITPGTSPQVRETRLQYGYNSTSSEETTRITDASGQITELTYHKAATGSPLDRQLKNIRRPMVGGTAPAVTFAYDAAGNVDYVIDERGNKISYGYDANGNRIFESNAQGNIIERTFNSANQVLTETAYTGLDTDGDKGAGGGSTTYYVYDSTNPTRLMYVVSPEGRVTRHEYNNAITGQRTATVQFTNDLFKSWGQDFSLDASGFNSTAGFVHNTATRRLEYTASTTTSSATIYTTDTAPLGSIWSAEISTPAQIGTDLLFLALESGSGTTLRRMRLRLSNGQFSSDTQVGSTPSTPTALPQATAKANTTYIVEFDTTASGEIKLYVYEKGKPRSSATSVSMAAVGGWTTPKLVIQGNSGPTAQIGTVAIDNLNAQLRPTLQQLNDWVSTKTDKTAWSRAEYGYDAQGNLNSQLTYSNTDSYGNGLPSAWNDEYWSDDEVTYLYDTSGNLLEKTETTKLDGLMESDNTWAMAQRRLLGIVYGANDPNGVQGEPKKAAHLTLADRNLITAKSTFKTVYAYDGLNRVTQQTDGLGQVVKTTYTDTDRGVRIEYANGLTSLSTYDRAGRLALSEPVRHRRRHPEVSGQIRIHL